MDSFLPIEHFIFAWANDQVQLSTDRFSIYEFIFAKRCLIQIEVREKQRTYFGYLFLHDRLKVGNMEKLRFIFREMQLIIYPVKDKLFNKFVINNLLANTALQTERQKMKILKRNNWFFHAVSNEQRFLCVTINMQVLVIYTQSARIITTETLFIFSYSVNCEGHIP